MITVLEAKTWAEPFIEMVRTIREAAYHQATKTTPMGEFQCRVRTQQPTVGTGQVLTGIAIKTSQLLAPISVSTNDPGWRAWLEKFSRSWLSPLERAIHDKFLLGLSWLVLEVQTNGSPEPILTHVDTENVLWNPSRRIDDSDIYWRKLYVTSEEFSQRWPGMPLPENYTTETRSVGDDYQKGRMPQYCIYVEYTYGGIRFLTEGGKVIQESLPNPCSPGIPIFPVMGLYPAGVDVPMSDWEMGYSQQKVLDEVRESLLSYARKGGGFIVLPTSGITPGEIEKLQKGSLQEPFIFYDRELPVISSVQTPAPPQELLALENMVQGDINARLGVSDYERLNQPTEGVSFATEAQLIAQSSSRRARKDLMELKQLQESILEAYARYTLFQGLGGQSFSSEKSVYTIPMEPPDSIDVRDVLDGMAEQLKAQFLVETFGPQLQSITFNGIKLLEKIASYLGITKAEIEEMEPGGPPITQVDPETGEPMVVSSSSTNVTR